VPTIIVIWMFFVAYKGFKMMREPPADAMVVEVTGRQWAWEFAYPGEKITSSEMVVPVNTPVKALITAPVNDVLHSFYLPDFRVKEDAVPGKETYLWFEAERKGVYNIFCAEYCGKDHSKMHSKLHVVSDEEYREWVVAQIAKRYKPLEFEGFTNPEHPAFGKEDLNIDTEKLYGTYCASCHGVAGDGSGLPNEARDFRSDEDWQNGTRVTDIFRTLMTGIEDSQMRAFPNLTPWERVALAHHVRSFQKNELDNDSQESYDELVKEFELDKITGPGKSISVERAMKILAEEAAGVQKGDGATQK
jgi:mono/diheme cytochrome c family protein